MANLMDWWQSKWSREMIGSCLVPNVSYPNGSVLTLSRQSIAPFIVVVAIKGVDVGFVEMANRGENVKGDS